MFCFAFCFFVLLSICVFPVCLLVSVYIYEFDSLVANLLNGVVLDYAKAQRNLAYSLNGVAITKQNAVVSTSLKLSRDLVVRINYVNSKSQSHMQLLLLNLPNLLVSPVYQS